MTATLTTHAEQTSTARARTLMARSRANHFAVGAFNVDNLETLRAVCRAAKNTRSPVIVELSRSEVEVIGLENARAVLDNEIAALDIEAYLNLDHAPSASLAKSAIDAGFEFVHLDLFQADEGARDVLAATREVVAYAARTGAVVEGDAGRFVGSSTRHQENVNSKAVSWSLSTPGTACAFVEATGIDTFAVAIGNVHGRYPRAQSLDFDLLGQLRSALAVNLSLHGGSGLTDAEYRAAARRGVSKININTDLRIAYRRTLELQLAGNPDEYAIAKLVGPVVDAVQRVVEGKIRVFGSAGQGRPPRRRQ